MTTLLNALEQLLLPAECLVCHRLLGPQFADDLVCRVCRLRWRPVRRPWCERCGQPEPHFGPCRLCRAWPAQLTAARSAVWLDGGARRAVHALKYDGLARAGCDMAAVVAKLVERPPPGALLVPIPLGPKRLARRGYNQSEILAAALGRLWGLTNRPELLVRTRDTPTQTALTPAARLANVAGAFEVRIGDCGLRTEDLIGNSAISNPKSAIVLIDDVFTTGATLAEAAHALADAGCQSISAVTFGRASIPDFN
ncbi:MAG TPA: double zinc ribbon domain-containing protein [Gemmatimonadales bacterium]|nr:double zinc ribbon domain-containing protein [Gemmatimonadales bacterium]